MNAAEHNQQEQEQRQILEGQALHDLNNNIVTLLETMSMSDVLNAVDHAVKTEMTRKYKKELH